MVSTAEDALGAPVNEVTAAQLTRSGYAGGYVTDAIVEAGIVERTNGKGHVNGVAHKDSTEKVIPPPPTWESTEAFFASGHQAKLLAVMRGRQEDIESLSTLVDIGDRSKDQSQSRLFTFPDAEVAIVVTASRESAGQPSQGSKILLVDTSLQTPGVERPTYDITSTGVVEGPHGYSFVFPMTDVGTRRTVRVLQLNPYGFNLQTQRVNSSSMPTFGTSPEVGKAIVDMSRHLMLKQNQAIFERSDVGRQARR